MKTLIITAVTILVAGTSLQAQTDPHFTQNYTFPLSINPAMTGTSDGDYRVSTVYRSQWGALGNPYRTRGISFDTRTDKNISLGANILHEAAGDGGFNYLNAYASVAYNGVKFGADNEHHIIFAMQAGLLHRSVDQSKFKWGEQWNPITGYNANNPTSESFAHTAATTLDMGTGVMYYDATPGKKYNAFGGLSFFHINKPKDPIVYNQTAEPNTIPLRYTLHGGVSMVINERTRLVPHILYMQQGNAREAMLGTYVQMTVNEETDFMFGGYYRVKDAIAPFAGIDWRNFIIGLSYDVNASKLGAGQGAANSFELSLSYIKRKGSKSIFDFIHCPRM